MHNYYAYLLLAVSILTTVKIFQFLHSPYCISGQYVLCRKENLIVREYNMSIRNDSEITGDKDAV